MDKLHLGESIEMKPQITNKSFMHGESEGHPFRGNQFSGGEGNGFRPASHTDFSQVVNYQIAADAEDQIFERQPIDNLTQGQLSARDAYTGSDYHGINEYKRGNGYIGKRYTDLTEKQCKDHAEKLQKAIDKSELPGDIYLYRGVQSNAKALKAVNVGDTYEDKGFQSFSLDGSRTMDFSRLDYEIPILRTRTFDGQKGLAGGGFHEKEVILPPAVWKVTGVTIVEEPPNSKGYKSMIKYRVVDVELK